MAEITGRTPAACRQLASSGRRSVLTAQAPATPATRQASIISEFRQAWEAGDVEALIGLLDPGATATGDGGGLVGASAHPIEGGEQVARYLAGLARAAPGEVRLLERTVNGQPGLVAELDGVIVAVYAFEIAGDRITRFWAVLNPDKLRAWVVPSAPRERAVPERVRGERARTAAEDARLAAARRPTIDKQPG